MKPNIDANNIIEQIKDYKDRKAQSIGISDKEFRTFKRICTREKIKPTKAIERMMLEFIQNPSEIVSQEMKDRKAIPLHISLSVYESFKDICNKRGLKYGVVVEWLLSLFNRSYTK